MTVTATAASLVDILVIGGGACGTLVARHLLDVGGLRVALVEPRHAPGLGIAYATPQAEHLLNVNAARMSAFDARPDDFVDFLARHPQCADLDPTVLPGMFAPRRLYGAYLQTRLDQAPADASLMRLEDTVGDLANDADGWLATLASGARIGARAVVLATGNQPGVLPCVEPGVDVVQAWDYASVAAIDADAAVCILGAGLSMVDVLLSLHANGHRGAVTAISRNGLMPLAHAPGTVAQAGGVDALLPLGVRARMRLLRRWAAEASAQGRPWQDALERLRPHVRALWQAGPEAEQRRFLRHAVRLWDIHRHRIAPEIAAVVAAMSADGRFVLHAGRLTRIAAHEGQLAIEWTPRGSAPATLTADVIVNATGMEKRLARMPGPLWDALRTRGLVRPGPLDLGVATEDDGALIDAQGRPVGGLWTLGANRIGDLWETIAMPELRGQAARVAAAAAAHAQAMASHR